MSSKPFLIIQLRPEDATADNEFAAFLKYGRLKIDQVVRLRAEDQGIPKLNLDDYAAIIVGGSPFDVSTPASRKSVQQKKLESDFHRLFAQVIDRDFPFLGACAGPSLLGNFCGAVISTKYSEPVSGIDVFLTQEGQQDPLLKNLPAKFRALVGHKEACEAAPPNSTLLAYSKTAPVQIFRVKNNIYATQFHPEADAEAFILRINVYKNHGYFKPEEAAALIAAIKNEDTPVPKEILRRFIGRYLPSA